MLCAIWYQLYNLKNVKNTHEGVLITFRLHSATLLKKRSSMDDSQVFSIALIVSNRASISNISRRIKIMEIAKTKFDDKIDTTRLEKKEN